MNGIMSGSGAMSTALPTTTSMAIDNVTATSRSLLREPTSSFPLWSVALITLSALVVTSMLFVMVVLLCRMMKERKSKHHTYSTRQWQGLH